MEELLKEIEASIADAHFSDDEKRDLIHSLREASPAEEGLRRLRNRAFELVRVHSGDASQPHLLKWLEGVVRALDVARLPAGEVRSRACFSPGMACLSAIREHLGAARRRIDLCVFTLSDDRITESVLAAHRRGVALRFITDNDKEYDAGSDVALLRERGVPVVVDRSSAHMHHKFAIVDETWLLNGSYNWTRSACEHNEENLIVTNETGLVRSFQAQFEALWARLR
jgi:cardiolipin hydrolase